MGNPKKRRSLAILLLPLIFLVAACHGSFVGVADPDVRASAFDILTAMETVQQVSATEPGSPSTVRTFAGHALIALSQIERKSLSDLDKDKYDELARGIQSLIDRSDERMYCHVTSFIMGELASTIGMYESGGVEESKALYDQAREMFTDGQEEGSQEDDSSQHSEAGGDPVEPGE